MLKIVLRRSFSELSNSVGHLLDECISYYHDQRDLNHRIVLHCDSGIGRTGVFAVLFSFIGDIVSGKGVPDIMMLSTLLSEGRKNLMLNEKHLIYTFQLALSYLVNSLIKCE